MSDLCIASLLWRVFSVKIQTTNSNFRSFNSNMELFGSNIRSFNFNIQSFSANMEWVNSSIRSFNSNMKLFGSNLRSFNIVVCSFSFSFFLEKSMLLYFLKMMNQKSNQICVQLLQTLSILFENIRNETSLCELEIIQ